MYIRGLVHLFSVTRPNVPSSDGAGGQTFTYSNVITNKACRVAVLSSEQLSKEAGLDGKGHWQIVCEYSPTILDSDLVTLDSSTPAPAGSYQIVKIKHHIDHLGNYDHTNIIVVKK